MKAYEARDGKGYHFGTTVIFASSAREAKALALQSKVLEDVDFLDIRVCRLRAADKLYKGEREIDWNDDETRLVLVRDFGWQCEEQTENCLDCVAREWCAEWEAYMDTMEDYGA
ncbi:MAG: hypothetical protein NC311_12600 [Muribaculaceae bacterium]|nr:hypothetical protein [Muribaculaceae bacterium]MCM1439670.1 hypothetical protein [Roseburia sp.]